jgi:hypothetical protein
LTTPYSAHLFGVPTALLSSGAGAAAAEPGAAAALAAALSGERAASPGEDSLPDEVTATAPPLPSPPAPDQAGPSSAPAPLAAPPEQPPPAAATTLGACARFRLANARVGVDYCARVEGTGANGNPLRVVSVLIPDDMGLVFDPERGELRGKPARDGEHRLALQWKEGNTTSSGEVLLIVNPDPRTLWKIHEPAADAPYPKPHLDQQRITGDGFRIAAASRRGRSHEHAGSHRDDDFFVAVDPENGWSVLIVADGAGSARFSRKGSELAVRIAGQHLLAALNGDFGAAMAAALSGWEADASATAQAMGGEFYYLFHRAATLAVQAIEQEASEAGAAARDYATTLLIAAVRRLGGETFVATFWMGDGAIAVYGPRGHVRLMGKPDGGEFAGQTRFLDRAALSDPGFARRVVIGRLTGIAAVMLLTDGISDPKFETDNGLADPARWDRLWDELAPCLSAVEPEQELLAWLGFFSPGHHDDRTIALLC